MIERFSRRQIVYVATGIVILILLGVVLVTAVINGKGNPREGELVERENVQIDEVTEILVQQRLQLIKSAVAAHESTGSDVPWGHYTRIAGDALMIGDLVTARDYYARYLEVNPVSHVIWNSYGNVLEAMNDISGAESAYRQAMTMYNHKEYYMDVVRLLDKYFEDREDEEKMILEQAVKGLGQEVDLMVYLGDWYMEHGNCEEALAHYEIAANKAVGDQSVNDHYKKAQVECR